MVELELYIDTQTTDTNHIKQLLQGGQITSSKGIINLLWEEFSAFDFARELALHHVYWDAVSDNAPGCLILSIHYQYFHLRHIQDRLQKAKYGIDIYSLTETEDRQTAVTDV